MSLANHLLGGTRSAVLASLLLHPESTLHVRELARITGASPGSLHRELRTLTELGLLLRQEAGRQVHYRANPACPILPDLAGLLRKTVGVADVLREALAPLADQIHLAFVYGSVAAGHEGPRSDVDVMVLGKAGFASVMRPGDFTRKRHAGDGFVASVIREPKLWLIGSEDDLAEPV